MANSSDVTAGNSALASEYNNLRADVLNNSTGHRHTGASNEGTPLARTGTADGSGVTSGKCAYWSADSVASDGDNTSLAKARCVGIFDAAYGAAATCYMQYTGDMTNANWSIGAGDVGKLAYVGADGYPTATRPNNAWMCILGIIKGANKISLNINILVTKV